MDFKLNSPEGKNLAEVLNEAMRLQGFDKTAIQCKSQWQYMAQVIKFGGYQEYKSQIMLVNRYLLLNNQRKNLEVSKQSSSYTPEQQVVGAANFLVDSVGGNSNKAYDESLSTCEAKSKDITPDLIKTSQISDNSFLEIFRHDTLLENSRQLETSSTTDRTNSSQELTNSFTEKENLDGLPTPSFNTDISQSITGIQKRKAAYQYPSCAKSNKIRVEVLSVTEQKESKLVECLADEGRPPQVIKLRFPVSYSFPANVKYINIPKTLVYPTSSAHAMKDTLEHKT